MKARHLALVAALGLAAVGAWWDGSQRRPADPAAGALLEAPGLQPDDRELTVVQFNIRRGRSPDGVLDLTRTAGCLRGAELVGLNEVGGEDWFDSRTQAQSLGEMLELAWLFGPSEVRWWQEHFGNGLLTALPLTEWKLVPLPWEASKSRRSRLEGLLNWNGQPVRVIVTHLDSGPDRALQLAELAERFAALPAPKILLGDLNTHNGDAILTAWQQDPDLVVTSGAEPAEGVDWIVAEGFALLESWRCEQGASDHPAVGARLEARF